MYAEVVVDISHEKVDRGFDYIIPSQIEGQVMCGSQVLVPFGRGNKIIKGVVLKVKERPADASFKLKEIQSLAPRSKTLESDMIELAWFIKNNYGSTLNQALKIVTPVKKDSEPIAQKYIVASEDGELISKAIEKYGQDKRTIARLRLLKEIANEKVLPYDIVKDKLNIGTATLKSLEKEGLIKVDVKENLRDAFSVKEKSEYTIKLNPDQQGIADDIWKRYIKGDLRPSLIRGVTGSGKTEVYIELIDRVIKAGKQAIVLIPEISLTYQTVLRFYKKFGDRISVINSKLTPAQKHDQLEKAKKGQVDIIIGPRSALFSPFARLGMIIIDEEHEGTYKNEGVPKYHSREVAIKRAEMAGAIVVMGSATPSVESYYKAINREYQLYSMEKRAKGAALPAVEVIDLRAELAAGNRSIISRKLNELILDRLSKNEQIILFINRRAYQSFVSCRSCGAVMKCPHCDVSLKYHKNGKLKCHYCGYEVPMVSTCPSCGSKYIGTFGAGTQKIEEEINKIYPGARTLRMDMDTTRGKDGHEKILSAFSNHEADILIGTQMIVKGHDFENVTLVGILAADLSLYSGDFMASERTFQLLTQAAGRAGRGSRQGEVIIQTYSPESYAVRLGASQNYLEFYELEMSYRKLLGYPPVMNMLNILIQSEDFALLERKCQELSGIIDKNSYGKPIVKIGPADAPIGKIQDKYRKMIYLKSVSYSDLTGMKDIIESFEEQHPDKNIQVIFDFSLRGMK